MSKTLKITLALLGVLVLISSFFLGARTERVDINRLAVCLEPSSGKINVKDADGKDAEVVVVIAGAISACIESN